MTQHLRGSENGNRFSPTGHEILTWHGRMIDLTDPRPESIFMEDIAASLAHQERFTGHCPLRPTIAQHSLAVEHIASVLAPREQAADPRQAARLSRAALMHDAAEFLVGDASGAVKLLMRGALSGAAARNSSRARAYASAFDKLETAASAAIVERFDCADTGWEEIIHEADCLACAYEMAHAGWCPEAAPPDWLKRDLYVQRCYSGMRPSDMLDGGEAAFLRCARALGMTDDRALLAELSSLGSSSDVPRMNERSGR